jgi:hypothetical protein
MAEILASRQQLAILNRTAKRPSLRFQDRLFWVTLARLWQRWRSATVIVKPETVFKWHRQVSWRSTDTFFISAVHISTHRERRIRAIVKGKFDDRERQIRAIVKGFH